MLTYTSDLHEVLSDSLATLSSAVTQAIPSVGSELRVAMMLDCLPGVSANVVQHYVSLDPQVKPKQPGPFL